MKIVSLGLAKLLADRSAQMRVDLPRIEEVAQEYAEVLKVGGQLLGPTGRDYPVAFSDGRQFWLADGFTRRRAHQIAGRKVMDCEVRSGTLRDAILYAVGANTLHGQRRTRADKWRAVETLLTDPEWCQWNNSEIARRVGVSHVFVGVVRNEFAEKTRKSAHPETFQDAPGDTRMVQRGEQIYRQVPPKPLRDAAPGEQLERLTKAERRSAIERIIDALAECSRLSELVGDDGDDLRSLLDVALVEAKRLSATTQ